MKHAKRMLCMLLVMLLAFSTVSIGVNAAYISYANPSGQTLHEKPLYTTAQRASQLLDYVDEMLAEEDFNEDYVVIKLDFRSVDKVLDSVAKLESAAGAVGGDVSKIDFDALPTTRRGTLGKTDLNILYELLYFLRENRDIVGKFINGNLNLGSIGTFVELDFNIHNMIVDTLYETLVDETYDPDNGTVDYNTWTVDKILAHALEIALAGGVGADGIYVDGAMPSLSGKINLNTQTIWQIIELAANAATKDLLIPFIKNDLADLLFEVKAANPSDAWRLIDISKLNLDGYVWGQYDSNNGIVAELNHFLYTVINQVWTGEKFWVDGGNEMLEQNLAEAIKIVYKELGTLILPASAEFLPQEEINAMNFQELVSYVAVQFLRSKMPHLLWDTATAGVEIPTGDMASIACTVAYSLLAELPVNSAYYIEDFEYGNIEWNKETALNMVADIGAYYLNGALPIDIAYGEGVESLMKNLVNWALADNNFGGFFAGCGVSASDSPWQKIDKTLFAILPLHQILGGGATGSYDLVMNKIVDNALNLNLEGLLSLFYKDSNGLLNKPAPQFVVNILNRVLNVIVSRNTQSAIFNPTPSSIDSLVQNSNLAESAKKLLQGLYAAGQYEYFWSSLLPIINPLFIDESGYAVNQKNPAAGYVPTTSLASLQAYVESIEEKFAEPEDVYDMDSSKWNLSVDYRLWRYYQLEDAIEDAWDVINGYNHAKERYDEAVANGDADAKADAQADMASYTADRYNQAGKNLSYYVNKVLNDQVIAIQGDLQYIIYIIEYNDDKIEQYVEENYPEDVWENYQEALDHAYTILDMSAEVGSSANPELKQSMVNAARRNLMDAMRLLEIDLADVTALAAKLVEAKAADTTGKTEESVAYLNELINRAEEFVAGSWTIDYQAEIDELVEDLQYAMVNLETKKADKTALEEAINAEIPESLDCCDPIIYSEYKSLLSQAVEMLNDTEITYETQEYVDELTNALVAKYDELIASISHEPGETVIENNVAPDCELSGSYDKVVYCTVCGEEIARYVVEVPALGHTSGKAVIENNIDPTCVKAGSYDKVVYCTVCDKQLSRSVVKVPALGHTSDEAVVENYKAPVCGNNGSYDEVVYCITCGSELSRESIEIVASGHGEKVLVSEVPPTATADGERIYKCADCGWTYYNEVVYTGADCPESLHNYSENSNDTQTFSAPGASKLILKFSSQTKVESNYDKIYIYNGDGSLYGTYTGTELASQAIEIEGDSFSIQLTSDGSVNYYGYSFSAINAITYDDDYREVISVECTHTNLVTLPAVAAICTATGLTEGKKCADCGVVTVAQITIPAKGHTAGTPVIEGKVEAAPTVDGYYYSVTYCTVCKVKMNSEKVVIPATGHTAGTPVRENIVAATCYAEGSYDEVVYCTCCSPKVELKRTPKTIEKLPHTEVVVEGYDATCTKTGLTDGKECSVCYEVIEEQEEIPVKPHNATSVVTAPTCEAEGYTTYTCKDCGNEEVKDYVDALGHTEVVVPGYAAECEKTGLTDGKVCSVCDKELVKQEEIPATGHTPGAAQKENRVEATFETAGSYDLVVRCTVCTEVLESETVVIPAGKDGPAYYEALNALVKEAKALDRSIYKAASLKALDAVLAKITNDITAGEQSIVDGWVEELRAVLDTMEVDDTKAEAKVTTVISDKEVNAGDIVTVTVKLTTNFYVTNLQIPVLFDQTQFEVVGTKTNKNYLTFSDMFATRNYAFGGSANKQQGFDKTVNAALWNTDAAKAQYGVAYITAVYDSGIGMGDTTFARPQGDVLVTFQLKALTDVEDTSNSVFVSTDWAKTADNKAGMFVVGMTEYSEYYYGDGGINLIDYTRVSYEAETITIGVTVSGTVKSFDDKIDNSDDVTITFTATDSDAVYTTTVTGSGTQAYELKKVIAGTYTVTVSKANHVTLTYEVVVGEENVEQNFIIHLLGDVNSDGKVNTIDVARANAHANGRTLLDDDYWFTCADINGDGKVNTIDVALINAHAKGVRSPWK